MAVETAAIIVAIATAAGQAAEGAELPADLEAAAEAQVASVVESAPDVGARVDAAVATLPIPVQEAAAQLGQSVLDRLGVLPETDYAGDPSAYPWDYPSQSDYEAAMIGSSPWLKSGAGGSAAPLPSGPLIQNGSALVPPVPEEFSMEIAPIGAVAVFAPWLRKAGAICKPVTAETVGALYALRGGFAYGKGSLGGEYGDGPGAFTKEDWELYGQDADGDGAIDITSVADATVSTGRQLCDLAGQAESWLQEGAVAGDVLEVTLAAYLGSPEAVLAAGGLPSPVGDGASSVASEIADVLAAREPITAALAPFFYGGSGFGISEIVDAAAKFIGLPYVWGGGGAAGPSMGGFDCSGLTTYAVNSALGVVIPRTSEEQWLVGSEVSLAEAKPGDLVFGEFAEAGPGHVGIYVGEGQMLHAPTSGDVVRISAVFPDMRARTLG